MVMFGVVILIPLAFSNAFLAYLLWGWSALIAVDSYLYGFMRGMRLNMTFGLIALLMIFMKRDTLRGSSLKESPAFVLIVLFLLQATISASFAYPGNSKNWDLYDKIIKSFLFALAMPLVVVGRDRIHVFVITLCLALGFHGLIDGLKFISSGGGHNAHGLIKFGDNNHYAVMMVMIIPLFLYLGKYMSHRHVRFGMYACALLTIAAVVSTNSRGGLLSMVAMGGWLVLTSRQRLSGLMMFLCGALLVFWLAPESWFSRMDTIGDAQEDSSFMARVEAWQVSSAIALHNPFTGGGLHAVQVQSVWTQFKGQAGLLSFVDLGPPSEIFRAAHSIYFEVLGDMGFSGLLLFLSILFVGMRNGRRTEALLTRRQSGYEWAIDLSRTLSAVIFGYAVGGASVSLAYSEFIYVIVMLTEVLKREVSESMLQKSRVPVEGRYVSAG